jgi:hypothetical protein
MKNMKKCLIWVVFGPPPRPWPFSMGSVTLTLQRCIPNMKTIPLKLWSVASGNQTVSGGGGVRDQNQSIPTSSGDTIIGCSMKANVLEMLKRLFYFIFLVWPLVHIRVAVNNCFKPLLKNYKFYFLHTCSLG